jgi:hypothetical protein
MSGKSRFQNESMFADEAARQSRMASQAARGDSELDHLVKRGAINDGEPK